MQHNENSCSKVSADTQPYKILKNPYTQPSLNLSVNRMGGIEMDESTVKKVYAIPVFLQLECMFQETKLSRIFVIS